MVEREPLKKGRYHTFGVVSPAAGLELMRMSTESKPDADRWIEALRSAGCEERELTPESRIREPLQAADVRWVRFPPACDSLQRDRATHIHTHKHTQEPALKPSLSVRFPLIQTLPRSTWVELCTRL